MGHSQLKVVAVVVALATGAVIADAPLKRAEAQRGGQIVGAGAAGLALGVIIGSMANQGQAQQSQSEPAPRKQRPTTNSGSSRSSQGSTRSVAGATASAGLSRGEVEKIQESLNLLGYDAGTVDGSLGPQTVRAVEKFQSDNDFPATGRLTAAERKVLTSAVEQKTTKVTGSVSGGDVPKSPETANAAVVDSKVEIAHWETVRQSSVAEEIEDYISRYPNGQFRRLAELRLEKMKQDLQKSVPPPVTVTETTTPDSALPPINDSAFPKARQRRADAVAVIIGNSAYGSELPRVDFGHRDAEALRLLAMKTLGVESQNVIFIKDATRAAMEKAFGSERDYKGELWRRIDPDGISDVFVFYSGHGVAGMDEANGVSLLPVDADPKQTSFNGYPVSLLLKNLEKLKTKSTTVFLDACFSGQAADANATPIIKNASPVYISKLPQSDAGKLNVFAAAGDRQLASWDVNAGHGLFTRQVLLGLSGEADENKDKDITAKELADYVSRNVRKAARRMHGREQDPQFTGSGNFIIANY